MDKVLLKFKKIISNGYFWLAALFIVNLLMAAFYISPGFQVRDDAATYQEAIKFIQGKHIEGLPPLNRLLTTPLLLLSTITVDTLIHNPYYSIAFVNLIFFILIILVFYKLAFEIFKEQVTAFLATVLFMSNYYLLGINNLFIADMAGRFFLILTNLLAVKYFLSEGNKKYFYLAILSSSIGVLFKEFGALGMISLVILIALSRFEWKKKIGLIIKASALFAIIPLLFHILFYFKFHFSYFDWYSKNITLYPSDQHQYGLGLFIKVMGWLFLAGWPLFVWGLTQAKKFLDKQKFLILAGLLPASLAFFAWPMFMQRTAFVLVPWLSLIAGFGLAKIKNKYIIAVFIIIYLAVNYNIERLLPVINLPF